LGGKRAETDSAPFIIQEQQAEWVNVQRQILRPLSYKNNKLGGKRAETDFAPFIILEEQAEWVNA